MKSIEHFMLPENTNSLYKNEAISSISLTRAVADKINELVDAYNKLAAIDLEWKQTQEGTIRKGIIYMKDNLVNSLNDLMEQLNDSGFIDERIAANVRTLKNQVDNLLQSETTDGELLDVRVGGNGKTYDTAGNSVRSQINELRNELSFFIGSIQKEMNAIECYENAGYLTLYNGVLTFRGENENHSKTTLRIPCKEGEVFTYTGIGRSSSYSWVFFNDDFIVSTGQHNGTTSVVIPSGVNFVQFSSFDILSNDVVLSVEYKTNEIELRVSELEKRSNIYNITEQEGYYTLEEGVLQYKGNAEYHSKTSGKIPCNENEVFLYSGVGRSSTLSWVMYNGNTVVSTGQYNGSTSVVIPAGVNFVQFSSFAAITDEVVLNIYYMSGESVTNSNVLSGKKYVACGDSFTIGDYSDSPTNDYIFTDGLYSGEKKSYPYFIGRRNNMIVVNEAIGGSTLTNIAGRNPFSVDRYKNIPSDADYITIKLGINDNNQNAQLGTISDTVNTTFYGAWNVVLDYLTANFPKAKIGIIVTNGSALKYVNATIECAKKWGIPYLDLATDDKIPLMIRTNRTDVTQEAINRRNQAFGVNWGVNHHPNEIAHEFESTIVENWLRSL